MVGRKVAVGIGAAVGVGGSAAGGKAAGGWVGVSGTLTGAQAVRRMPTKARRKKVVRDISDPPEGSN
jgi:hypothetical protein